MPYSRSPHACRISPSSCLVAQGMRLGLQLTERSRTLGFDQVSRSEARLGRARAHCPPRGRRSPHARNAFAVPASFTDVRSDRQRRVGIADVVAAFNRSKIASASRACGAHQRIAPSGWQSARDRGARVPATASAPLARAAPQRLVVRRCCDPSRGRQTILRRGQERDEFRIGFGRVFCWADTDTTTARTPTTRANRREIGACHRCTTSTGLRCRLARPRRIRALAPAQRVELGPRRGSVARALAGDGKVPRDLRRKRPVVQASSRLQRLDRTRASFKKSCALAR